MKISFAKGLHFRVPLKMQEGDFKSGDGFGELHFQVFCGERVE
jgi:hypothetical protein